MRPRDLPPLAAHFKKTRKGLSVKCGNALTSVRCSGFLGFVANKKIPTLCTNDLVTTYDVEKTLFLRPDVSQGFNGIYAVSKRPARRLSTGKNWTRNARETLSEIDRVEAKQHGRSDEDVDAFFAETEEHLARLRRQREPEIWPDFDIDQLEFEPLRVICPNCGRVCIISTVPNN